MAIIRVGRCPEILATDGLPWHYEASLHGGAFVHSHLEYASREALETAVREKYNGFEIVILP